VDALEGDDGGARESADEAAATGETVPASATRTDTETIATSAVATRTKPADANDVIARAEARAEAAAAPAEAATAPSRRPVRWGRIAAGSAVVVAIVVVAWVGVRAYVDRQWYVGVHDGNVAVFNGIPARPLGFRLSHVVSVSSVPAATAEGLEPWKGLAGGITADSRTAADALVTQIRSDVYQIQGGGSAVPAPTTSP